MKTSKKDHDEASDLEESLQNYTDGIQSSLDQEEPAVAAKPKGTLPKGFEAPTPQPAAKPTRPRGRPRKVTTDTAPKPTRPRGRPRKVTTDTAPKPATAKPKGTLPKGFGDKPPEAPKPAPKPATAKPKGTLPKGFGDKPPEAPKPAPKETPKPAETKSQPPATFNAALEDAYYASPQTSFHDYRTKVTGYSPSPNRYYVRLTAPVGNIPTTNWNDQKAKVTGYTQPSNQYFATRPRLAHHPPDKTFGSFSGVGMSFEGGTAMQEKPAPAPKPAKGKLPKGF